MRFILIALCRTLKMPGNTKQASFRRDNPGLCGVRLKDACTFLPCVFNTRNPFALLLLLLLVSGCNPPAPAVAPANGTTSPSKSLPPHASDAALFDDVTQKAGIQFVHRTGAETGKYYFLETVPAGCALFDYDNDGWNDILLIQSGQAELKPGESRPHCVLYHNKGDGTFEDKTAESGFDRDLGYALGVTAGDYDNDGWDDLFITGWGKNFLLHNERGTGKFADVTAAMGLNAPHGTGFATSAAFGDYDNDGKLDLFVCYYCPWTPALDTVCHNALGIRDYCSPELYTPEAAVLWHNEGKRFRDVSRSSGIASKRGRGLAVTFLDYDEDGKQDIFVANDLSGNFLWHNVGGGKFVENSIEVGVAYAPGGSLMAGMGITLGDYSRSGHESVFVTNFEAMPNMLFKNDGSGIMEDVSVQSQVGPLHMPFLSFGCAFLDYDADGWTDLLIANGHVQVKNKTRDSMKQRKQLLHNNQKGAFVEISDPAALGAMSLPTIARGLATGDFDNDGRVDALFSNQDDPPQLLRNRDTSVHHWVAFKTIGTKSNRSGLHTRFVLHTASGQNAGSVPAGGSYLSAGDRRVYFGLGDDAKIERVEVIWASGTKETLTNVAADAGYIVTEGKGITGKLPKSSSAAVQP